MLERLQKIMAAAGVASRRKSEELISSGLVTVNGQIVSELGAKADPEHDHIRVNGKLLHGAERKVYLVLNKPKGYVSTVTDPEGRPTIMDLVRGVGERLFPVGRLDYLSEGLLLLTNDGELMQRLTRAASHVPKTYLVKVSGKPAEEAIEKLRRGIMLPPETRPGETTPKTEKAVKTAPAQITLFRDAENPWYEVILTEGRNRQIRRMFKQVGHNVEKIKRVRFGALELDVEPGEFRRLSDDEVALLSRAPKPRPSRSERPSAGAGGPRRPQQRRGTAPRSAVRDEKKPGRLYRISEGGDRRPARNYPSADRGEARPARDRKDDRGEGRAERKPREYRNEGRPAAKPTRGFSPAGRGEDRPDRGYRGAGRNEQRPKRGYQGADRGERKPRPEYRFEGSSDERPTRGFRPAGRGEDRPDRGYRGAGRNEQRPTRGYQGADRGERKPRPEYRFEGSSAERPSRGFKPAGRGEGRPARSNRSEERPSRGSRPGPFGDKPARGFKNPRGGERKFERGGKGPSSGRGKPQNSRGPRRPSR